MIDPRYKVVKELLRKGEIKTFTDIFKWIPKTKVSIDLHMNGNRMTKLIHDPSQFTMANIFKLSELIGCDEKKLLYLAGIEAEAAYRKNNPGSEEPGKK